MERGYEIDANMVLYIRDTPGRTHWRYIYSFYCIYFLVFIHQVYMLEWSCREVEIEGTCTCAS